MMIMHDDGKVAGSLVRPVRLSITLYYYIKVNS